MFIARLLFRPMITWLRREGYKLVCHWGYSPSRMLPYCNRALLENCERLLEELVDEMMADSERIITDFDLDFMDQDPVVQDVGTQLTFQPLIAEIQMQGEL